MTPFPQSRSSTSSNQDITGTSSAAAQCAPTTPLWCPTKPTPPRGRPHIPPHRPHVLPHRPHALPHRSHRPHVPLHRQRRPHRQPRPHRSTHRLVRDSGRRGLFVLWYSFQGERVYVAWDLFQERGLHLVWNSFNSERNLEVRDVTPNGYEAENQRGYNLTPY